MGNFGMVLKVQQGGPEPVVYRPLQVVRSKDRKGKEAGARPATPPRFAQRGEGKDHAFPPRPLLSFASFITSPSMIARVQQTTAASDHIAPFVP